MPVTARILLLVTLAVTLALPLACAGAGRQPWAHASPSGRGPSPWPSPRSMPGTVGQPLESGQAAPTLVGMQSGAYGGADFDTATAIQATGDGGAIVAGYTISYGAGDAQAWVLKLDGASTVTWQKTYGAPGTSRANAIYPIPAGGYILAGYTDAFGMVDSNPPGNGDAWVLKLDGSGAVVWQKTYGGSSLDEAYAVYPLSDGYIVAGVTYSSGAGNADGWLLKLADTGNITWQKTYGGSGYEAIYALFPTADFGFIAAGYTSSSGAGGADGWVLKLDSSGLVVWQKTYGTNRDEVLYNQWC